MLLYSSIIINKERERKQERVGTPIKNKKKEETCMCSFIHDSVSACLILHLIIIIHTIEWIHAPSPHLCNLRRFSLFIYFKKRNSLGHCTFIINEDS